MLIGLLKKMLSSKNVMPINEQMEYIDSLMKYRKTKEIDGYTRTYLHYKSIFCTINPVNKTILHIASIFLIPILIIKYLLNQIRCILISEEKAVFINANNKFGMEYDYSDRFPQEEIEESYGEVFVYRIKRYPAIFDGVLDLYSFRVWINLVIRYPFVPYMNLNCLMYLGLITRVVRQHNPSAIITAKVESNYTSSFITLYCESLNISYELIMHGELFLNRNMAFVQFTKMYVWDQYYKNMFFKLHAFAKEFIIFTPPMFDIHLEDHYPQSFITYYMTGTGDGDYIENTSHIVNILSYYSQAGYIVRVRPHPRWTDINELRSLCKNTKVVIEDHKEWSVNDSLSSTKYVIGSFSTVLLQAFYAGKTIVLDDITNKDGFKEIVDADYILLSKKHILLSEFIGRFNL